MKVMQQQLLCRRLNTGIEQPVLWRRELMPGFVVGLRPVSLHNDADLQIIHRWQAGEYTAHLSPDQLRVLYLLMAECTYAQAFMILQNDDKPIGQLEIYRVLQDELKDAYAAHAGDYRLNVPVLPVNTLRTDTIVQILRYCLSYFFFLFRSGTDRLGPVVVVLERAIIRYFECVYIFCQVVVCNRSGSPRGHFHTTKAINHGHIRNSYYSLKQCSGFVIDFHA